MTEGKEVVFYVVKGYYVCNEVHNNVGIILIKKIHTLSFARMNFLMWLTFKPVDSNSGSDTPINNLLK